MHGNSLATLLAAWLAMPCASAWSSEPSSLPRCEKDIKIIHQETGISRTHHPQSARIELEFTIDILGHVSDPVVVHSTQAHMNKEALATIVLWRYARPSHKCRHYAVITYRLVD
jgi:hypothetical protein